MADRSFKGCWFYVMENRVNYEKEIKPKNQIRGIKKDVKSVDRE